MALLLLLLVSIHFPTTAEHPSYYVNPDACGSEPSHNVLLPPSAPLSLHALCSRPKEVSTDPFFKKFYLFIFYKQVLISYLLYTY